MTGFALAPDNQPNLFDKIGLDRLSSRIADIRDLDAVRACVAETEPEIVIHMAAQSLVRRSYVDPVDTYAINVMGCVHLLEAMRENSSVKSAVIVTSDKAYENTKRRLHAYRESDPMGGADPYSSSKGCAELVTDAYRRSFFGLGKHAARIATARAGNVIGGGDWGRDRLVPDMVRAFSAGEVPEIRYPAAIRPWQHVLEPLSGYLRLVECLNEPDGARFAESWNFGPADEDFRPVSYVADTLAHKWGHGAAWHLSDKSHPDEAQYLQLDASKARRRLPWRPRLGLEEALTWTIEWHMGDRRGAAARGLIESQITRYEALGR